MKLKITRDSFVAGEPVKPGQTVDVSEVDGKRPPEGQSRIHAPEDQQRECSIEAAGPGDARGRSRGAGPKGGGRDADPGGTDGSYKDHHVAYALGAVYAQLGMPKEALERLTEARSTGFECLPWFERYSLLAPLTGTAAFQRFLDEFRQSWATQQARFPTGT